MRKFTYIFIFLLFSTDISAWNALGHRLVAQVAFNNMNSKSRNLFRQYNSLLNKNGRSYSLINSSVWLDDLYSEKFKVLKVLHYIDLPFSKDNTPLFKVDDFNAVFAIKMANSILANANFSDLDKAISARILLHVVGDIHQPLHAATKVSKNYPDGDKGGNLERLNKNAVARNLHAYWDRGGGLLIGKRHYTKYDVARMAAKLEQKWPCHTEKMQLNPTLWAEESHEIAEKFAYNLPVNSAYQKNARRLAAKRLAIAGCRLAALVNQY